MNWFYFVLNSRHNSSTTSSNIIVVVLLFIVTFSANASHYLLNDSWSIEQYSKLQAISKRLHSNKKLHDKFQAGETIRDYNVLHYDIALNWSGILTRANNAPPTTQYWDATVIMTICAKNDAITHIQIDAVDLDIRAVYTDDTPIQPKITSTTVTVPLPVPLAKGNTTKIKIDYRYSKFEQVGFYVFRKNTDKFVAEDIAYTFNSPEFARFWLPCNDSPNDKATLSICVTVPEGYTAVSNGKLDSAITCKATNKVSATTTFYWSDTTAIATYLINVVASVFDNYTEKFARNPRVKNSDSLEINYFAWKDDLKKTRQKLHKTATVLEYFASIFTPYAFDKFAWTEIYPFHYAGMENQTNVNINRAKIMHSPQFDPHLIAHEVAHHWFGNLVSTNDWNDIWFKEGAAIWSEALWAVAEENNQTAAAAHYFGTMLGYAKQYKLYSGAHNIPIYGCSPAVFFDIPTVFVIYNKAGWLFHQLNCLLGQNMHLSVLRKLLADYAYKSISVTDFIAVYKSETKDKDIGFDLEIYFKNWLFGAGHPKYNLQICRFKDENIKSKTVYEEVDIILKQEQSVSNVAVVFEQPIWLVFHNNGTLVHTEKVLNNAREQKFTFYNVPDFTTCSVDTLRTLCENKQTITSVESEPGRGDFVVFPNPVMQQNHVYLMVNGEFSVENFAFGMSDFVIVDMFGNEKIASVRNIGGSVEVDVSGLASGVYSVRFGGRHANFVVLQK